MVQYNVLRLFDRIMNLKLISLEHKSTSSLIYLVNNIFLLHDVFVGTPLAKRIVARSKLLLNFIAKRSKFLIIVLFVEDINEDQDEEIKELLNMPSLKGSDFFINVYKCYD